MIPKTARTLRRADAILAAIVLLAAAALMVGRGLGRSVQDGHEVVVEVDNREFRRVAISQVSQAIAFDVPAPGRHKAVVEVAADGRARVRESDCPDRVCVRTGWISRPGEVVICLPNRIVVRMEGGPRGARPSLDGIAY